MRHHDAPLVNDDQLAEFLQVVQDLQENSENSGIDGQASEPARSHRRDSFSASTRAFQ